MITEPTITIVDSRRHVFLLDEKFHPGLGEVVAATGWNCTAMASGDGIEVKSKVILALSRSAVEALARESARNVWELKKYAPYKPTT